MEEKKQKKVRANVIILILIGILVVGIIGVGMVLMTQRNDIKNKKENAIKQENVNNTNHQTNSRIDPSKYLGPIDKPIIYLYPTQEIEVEVKLGNPQYLSCTYPKYQESWKVIANPTGDLIEKETGRKLYALYWEGKNIPKENKMQEGFCIKGEETATFLEEKLAKLGLNEREAEEFIIYWLPKMEPNVYNYIRFETREEQEKAMPLEITPKPDAIIRIMMDWKGLEKPIEVEEQKIITPTRKGYVAVEWGGTELKD